MLSFSADQPVSQARAAATLLVVRPAEQSGIELFCVRRHGKSAFLGGAVVFPGGKLDAADAEPALLARSNGVHVRAALFSGDDDDAAGLAMCACRESLEEAALLPSTAKLTPAQLEGLQAELGQGRTLLSLALEHDLHIDTAALVPFARWVTPVAEQRRYDTRFFLTRAPAGQLGRHDDHETTAGVWAPPGRMIEAFMAGDVFLAPPTLRTLELLRDAADVEAALALANAQSLLPICPKVIAFDPLTLVLPGDPEHDIAELRVAGPTRFVLTDGRLISSD